MSPMDDIVTNDPMARIGAFLQRFLSCLIVRAMISDANSHGIRRDYFLRTR